MVSYEHSKNPSELNDNEAIPDVSRRPERRKWKGKLAAKLPIHIVIGRFLGRGCSPVVHCTALCLQLVLILLSNGKPLNEEDRD